MSCPICNEETVARYRPFCSKRCADIDLGRWLKGDYAVPATAPEDTEKAAEEMARATPRLH